MFNPLPVLTSAVKLRLSASNFILGTIFALSVLPYPSLLESAFKLFFGFTNIIHSKITKTGRLASFRAFATHAGVRLVDRFLNGIDRSV